MEVLGVTFTSWLNKFDTSKRLSRLQLVCGNLFLLFLVVVFASDELGQLVCFGFFLCLGIWLKRALLQLLLVF